MMNQDFNSGDPTCSDICDSSTCGGDVCGSPCVSCGTPNIVCGDGTREGAEKCDDANTNNGDGCNQNCQVENGWTCQMTAGSQLDNCTQHICGNGVQESSEECDDANTASGDGCSPLCTIELNSACGNGLVEKNLNEQCDKGAENGKPTSGCKDDCTFDTKGKKCEEGFFLDCDGNCWTPSSVILPRLGNGVCDDFFLGFGLSMNCYYYDCDGGDCGDTCEGGLQTGGDGSDDVASLYGLPAPVTTDVSGANSLTSSVSLILVWSLYNVLN